jgi:hypothetical protein
VSVRWPAKAAGEDVLSTQVGRELLELLDERTRAHPWRLGAQAFPLMVLIPHLVVSLPDAPEDAAERPVSYQGATGTIDFTRDQHVSGGSGRRALTLVKVTGRDIGASPTAGQLAGGTPAPGLPPCQ